jgi:hypothetical protein
MSRSIRRCFRCSRTIVGTRTPLSSGQCRNTAVSKYTSLAVKSESDLNTAKFPHLKHRINTRRKSRGQKSSTVFHYHLQYSTYAMHLGSLAMSVFLATSAFAQSIVVGAPSPGANIPLASNLTVQIERHVSTSLLAPQIHTVDIQLIPI